MPLVVALPDKRDQKVTLHITLGDMDELQREALSRHPLTVSQLAYERYVRGAAAEKRSRSREVFRIVGRRVSKEVAR